MPMIAGMLDSSLGVALIDAHFVPYALLAFGVIGIRLVGRKMRGSEYLFLLVIGLLFVVEGEQLFVSRRTISNVFVAAAARYFGVLSPFLWIFAAKGVSYAWGHRKAFVRWPGRVLIVVGLAFVFLVLNVAQLVVYRTQSTAYDTAVAVEQIAPIIKADYMGPARQPSVKRSLLEYFTGKRPLISSPFAAAGWAVRGDACGATEVACPYQEDYLFLPMGGNYNGIEEVDSKIFIYVAHVRGGLGTTWALFRRRTTPGRTRN